MSFVWRKKLSNRELLKLEFDAKRDGLIVKRYKDKIVLAKRPEKLTRRTIKRRRTARQKERQGLMKEAVHFGKGINRNPTYKLAWKQLAKGYTNVFQAAVSWYLKNGADRKVIPPHLK